MRFASKNNILVVSFKDDNYILIKDLTSQFYKIFHPPNHHKDIGQKVMNVDLLEDETKPDNIRVTYHIHDTSDMW